MFSTVVSTPCPACLALCHSPNGIPQILRLPQALSEPWHPLAPGSDEPQACLVVEAAAGPRIHHNAKSPDSGLVGFNTLPLGSPWASLSAALGNLNFLFIILCLRTLLPLAAPCGNVIPARESIPAEPFPRQHGTSSQCGCPPPCALWRSRLPSLCRGRSTLSWSILAVVFLAAGCLSLATQSAYCARPRSCSVSSSEHACAHTRMHGDSTTGVKLQSRSKINAVDWSSKYPTQFVPWYDASAVGPHLRLQSGAELVHGRTTPSCCTLRYCSALCPKV